MQILSVKNKIKHALWIYIFNEYNRFIIKYVQKNKIQEDGIKNKI